MSRKEFDFYLSYEVNSECILNKDTNTKINKDNISILGLDSKIATLLSNKGITRIEDLIFLTNHNLTRYGLTDSDIDILYDSLNSYLNKDNVGVINKASANDSPKKIQNELSEYLKEASVEILSLNGIDTVDKLIKLKTTELLTLTGITYEVIRDVKKTRASLLSDRLIEGDKLVASNSVKAVKHETPTVVDHKKPVASNSVKTVEEKTPSVVKDKKVVANNTEGFNEILNQEIFSLNNSPLLKNKDFNKLLSEYEEKKIIFEFADNKFIHIKRLNRFGIMLDTINEYKEEIKSFYGNQYFTMYSLDKEGFISKVLPIDVTTRLRESFLKSSDLTKYYYDNKVLFQVSDKFNDNIPIYNIMASMLGYFDTFITPDDMAKRMKEEYDITLDTNTIIKEATAGGYYYLKETNKIYKNEWTYNREKEDIEWKAKWKN